MVVGFLASRTGRWLRIVTGAGLVLGGLASGTSRGAALALVGLGPLIAGTLDLVLVAPLFGLPMRGEELRRELGVPEEEPLLQRIQASATRPPPVTIH
ncbi:hypothetical protein [Pyxidicoccus trucidator]|uniref:hypothetical protein n=1 Tax=Pyxidicoccus trucidator TaxID=2709662 RepID=UPI0013D97DB3|nr:hypothetical protein [Pyxidicoccus trucidator]